MISISIHKDKRGTWQMRVMDAGANDAREILRGGAATPRDAAIWLLRNVNGLAAEVEARLVELGFLTEAECEDALADPEADSTPKIDSAMEPASTTTTNDTAEKPA